MSTEVKQPEGWRPEPGSVIEGKLVGLDVATSTQRNSHGEYPEYPLLTIQTEDGSLTNVHCFHQTLQQAILTRRPNIGARIKIAFHGKQELKSDKTRSVAIYSLELLDTPFQAKSVYDRLDKKQTRKAPAVQPDVDVPDLDDDDIGF